MRTPTASRRRGSPDSFRCGRTSPRRSPDCWHDCCTESDRGSPQVARRQNDTRIRGAATPPCRGAGECCFARQAAAGGTATERRRRCAYHRCGICRGRPVRGRLVSVDRSRGMTGGPKQDGLAAGAWHRSMKGLDHAARTSHRDRQDSHRTRRPRRSARGRDGGCRDARCRGRGVRRLHRQGRGLARVGRWREEGAAWRCPS